MSENVPASAGFAGTIICCYISMYLYVVKDHILPVILPEVLLDQYVFKPTGIMTAGIVNITCCLFIFLYLFIIGFLYTAHMC